VKQQINLYQPIFRQPRKVFSAVALLQVAAVFALGLLIVYGYGRAKVRALDAQVATLQGQRTAAAKRLATVKAQFPEKKPDPLVAAELKRLQQELGYTQKIATALSTGAFGNTSGLSPFLAGLARQHVEGTWFSRVAIANGGEAIGVRGYALAPELLPAYVRRLAAEQVFAGKSFSHLELVKSAPEGKVLEFELRTEGFEMKDAEKKTATNGRSAGRDGHG
jgi:hypothetical protein